MKCCSPMNSRTLRLAVFLFSLAPFLVFGHDPYEITTRVFLCTNSLEVRMTLAAGTAQTLIATNGSPAPTAVGQAELEALRPSLTKCAEEFFRVSSAHHPLIAQETKMTFSVEDHVEFALSYPRPGPGLLRLEAAGLAKLPDNEPFGAVLTAVDLVNNRVLGQKLLTARDPAFEVEPAAPLKDARPDSSKSTRP
jgi:hypothetical protein